MSPKVRCKLVEKIDLPTARVFKLNENDENATNSWRLTVIMPGSDAALYSLPVSQLAPDLSLPLYLHLSAWFRLRFCYNFYFIFSRHLIPNQPEAESESESDSEINLQRRSAVYHLILR